MKPNQVKFLDRYVGGFLVTVLGGVDKILPAKDKGVKRILLIMFWGIGSIINAIPVARELKEKYPGAEITVLAPAKSKDLFYGNRFVDKTIFIDLGIINVIRVVLRIRNKFDVVVDTEHQLTISALMAYVAAQRRIGFGNMTRAQLYTDKVMFNPKEHAVVNNLKLAKQLGARTDAVLETIAVSKEDRAFVADFLKEKKVKGTVVGIAPGSGETYPQRRWSKEKFVVLADALIKTFNVTVMFIGSAAEKNLITSIQGKMKHSSVNAAGISLGKSLALLRKCALFIGNDSGAVHMAAAQKVKTIGIYGPETPVIFGPFGDNCVGIYKGLDCSPHIKVYEGKYDECKYDYKCLSLISVEEVLYYAEQLLKENVTGMLISSERTV